MSSGWLVCVFMWMVRFLVSVCLKCLMFLKFSVW